MNVPRKHAANGEHSPLAAFSSVVRWTPAGRHVRGYAPPQSIELSKVTWDGEMVRVALRDSAGQRLQLFPLQERWPAIPGVFPDAP